MVKGIIFDIQKFALHDGPGIRTAVFLKGCGLRCAWCCNPESQILPRQLSWDKDKCTDSLNCTRVCTTGAIKTQGKKINIRFDACNACGNCIDECPGNALKIYGWETDAETVVGEVLKDMAYFRNSGGGITLTGGDPVFQPEFTMAILVLSKREGLHTCIETAGDYDEQIIMKIATYTDLFLFDFKHYRDSDHKKYTGISNTRILSNLDRLAISGKKIILRCPIIPGVNNTIEHFRAIAETGMKYDSILAVEIMPFHDWGFHKYEKIGMKRPLIGNGTVSRETAQSWIRMIKELGCTKIRLG